MSEFIFGFAGGAPASPSQRKSARLGGALRRAVGFAITASGFAVIAAHGLPRLAG